MFTNLTVYISLDICVIVCYLIIRGTRRKVAAQEIGSLKQLVCSDLLFHFSLHSYNFLHSHFTRHSVHVHQQNRPENLRRDDICAGCAKTKNVAFKLRYLPLFTSIVMDLREIVGCNRRHELCEMSISVKKIPFVYYSCVLHDLLTQPQFISTQYSKNLFAFTTTCRT